MTSFDMGEQREVCHNLVLSRHTILVRYGLRLPPIESLLQQTIGVELMRYLYDVTLHLHDYRRSSEEYSMECSDDGRGDISFSSLHSAIAELDEAEEHDVVVEDDDGVKSECYKQYFARSTTTCLEYPEEKLQHRVLSSTGGCWPRRLCEWVAAKLEAWCFCEVNKICPKTELKSAKKAF
ncbi:hypothetical protein Q1695_001308 [Nippostrongylus brasiliensis]|nr:hypothetical protein Q1695_001308 [Nippostrongylus brasiliensis]